MECEKEEGSYSWKMRPKFRAPLTLDPYIYKNDILVKRITKMPLWIQSFKWCGNDMDKGGNDVATISSS